MSIISRYISKTIIQVFLILSLIFCSVFFIVGLVREISSIGHHEYHLLQAIIYVALQLPSKFIELLPLVCLLTGIVGLGVFASSNELLIMRVSGYSIYRISWIVLRVAFILSMSALLIQEFVAPDAYRLAINNKAFQKSGGKVIRSQSSIWMRDNNQFIFIDSVRNNILYKVSKYYISDDNRLENVSLAQSVAIKDGKWHAKNVEQTKLLSTSSKASFSKSAIWDINIPLKFILLDSILAEELTLMQLRNYVFSYIDEHSVSNKYSLEFWERILQPLSTIIVMLLSVPIIFGPLRNSSLGARSLIGVSIGFLFYFMGKLVGPISIVWQFPPFLAVSIPIIIFTAMAGYMLKKYS